jgi:hypothetical protein
MKTHVMITNRALYDERVIDVITYGLSGLNGTLGIETTDGDKVITGQHGSSDYESDYGFRLITSQDYEIRHDQSCCCHTTWGLPTYDPDRLTEITDPDDCWVCNILVVDGVDVAQYVQHEGMEMLVDDISVHDLPEVIVEAMTISDDDDNSDHASNRRDSLVDYLRELESHGYRLMRNNDRGFSNEYTCIIVAPDADPDDVSDNWDDLSADDWADEYLYGGDAATQAYVSFRLID